MDESTIRRYHKLYESDRMVRPLAQKNAEDPVYFADGTHPVHSSEPTYGRILRGKEKHIRANTGRMRFNLNGALHAENLEVVIREDDTIHAQSTIELFQQLEELHTKAEKIYVVLNNARYHRSRLVKEYVLSSRIDTMNRSLNFIRSLSNSLKTFRSVKRKLIRSLLLNFKSLTLMLDTDASASASSEIPPSGIYRLTNENL